MPKPYSKTVEDKLGDPTTIAVSDRSVVTAALVFGAEEPVNMVYTPDQARDLARALRRAARVAEGLPARKPKARAPKVGDRVRVLEDSAASANVRAGDLGAVVGTDGGYLLVAMDKPRRGAHRESVGRAYDWFFRPEHVELVR